MARLPADTVGDLLRKTPLPKSLKAETWDAFHAANTTDDLTSLLKMLPLPQSVRADLWNLKQKQTSQKESRMLPRESKYGLGGREHPNASRAEKAPGSVSAFVAQFFRHFTAATLHDAAEAYKTFIAKDGK